MSVTLNPIVIIPARMASTRLPGKPLALIGGVPMIVRVWERATASFPGPVVVACDGVAIAEAVERAGGRAVLTDPDLPSGSDRIYAALGQADPQKKHDIIVNIQGDMPTLDLALVGQVVALMHRPEVAIGTLAALISEAREVHDPAVVKVAVAESGRALYFSRATIPHGEGPCYHHIGIYAYRRTALEQFVALPPSPLEKREKLEQLRALEAGMRIDVGITRAVPLGVDTPETLELARTHYEKGML